MRVVSYDCDLCLCQTTAAAIQQKHPTTQPEWLMAHVKRGIPPSMPFRSALFVPGASELGGAGEHKEHNPESPAPPRGPGGFRGMYVGSGSLGVRAWGGRSLVFRSHLAGSVVAHDTDLPR